MGEYVSNYPTHSEILCRGATAWNAWREENPSAVPDLKGVSLALREVLLNGANLREAWLQNSALRFAALSTADLEAADMSGADLMHAQLDQANLSAANLSKARLDHAHLAGVILTKANLCGARLRFVTLSTADLQAVDMSDADLMHARLDQANLSAANFKNARLDYADFAGANLSKTNLCGACLQHAKNLTQSQLEESTGSASTILPPHLHGAVSWSSTTSPPIEWHDLRALPGVIADVDDTHFNLYNRQRFNNPLRWGAPVLISAVVITISVWQSAYETTLLNMLVGQWASSTIKTSFPPEALTKAESAPEHRPPNAAVNMAYQTSSAEQDLGTELDDETTISRDLGAPVEPQVSEDRSAKALETNEPDPNVLTTESTPLVLVETPAAAWPHAIVPAESLPSSDLAHAGSQRQNALSFGAETRPNPPVRNPTRGQKIESAGIVSKAAMPRMPVRNPLR